MKKQIMWASQHLEIDTMTGQLTESEPKNTFDGDDEDEIDGEKVQRLMSTPFGLWKVDDSMNPYKQFKLWMGHTNFNINQHVVDVIKTIPGIEILTVLTRYRFMVGIGELFNFRDVRVSINKALKCNNSNKLQTNRKIKDKNKVNSTVNHE